MSTQITDAPRRKTERAVLPEMTTGYAYCTSCMNSAGKKASADCEFGKESVITRGGAA
jgi:hypothetical protein